MNSLGVKGRTKWWEAHEQDQQFGDNQSRDIGNSQSLQKEGNARINKVSAMQPGLAKIIEKVCISRYFECSKTDDHVAANASSDDYVDTGSSKWVYWLPKRQSTNCSPTYYGCENTVESDIGVAWASLPITRINMRVADESQILWIPVTLHNRGWMDNDEGHHGSLKAIPILHSVDVSGHTVTQHHVITIYTNMFNHIDGILRALAKKKTKWTEDSYFTVKFAQQKLTKYFAEVSPTTAMLYISAQFVDPVWMLQSSRKWDKGMDTNPENETSYTTQYQVAFLKYVENEYCANHRQLSVTKHENLRCNDFIPSATASESGQSSFHPSDLSSDDEEYIPPENVAEATPGRSDRAGCLSTAARLCFNSPPWSPKTTGGQLIWISMITTPTGWRLAEHIGYRISRNGGVSTRKRSQSMPILPMRHTTWSRSYHKVSE